MLKKLLKYDFRAILRYWWIGALSSVVLSLLGGWAISIFNNEKELPEILYVVAGIVMFVVVLGMFAFVAMTTILIFVRFYKNFFSDEGYLTFTLPVKRASLLNSKIISSTVANTMALIVFAIDIAIMLLIGLYYPEMFQDIFDAVRDFISYIVDEGLVGFAMAVSLEGIILFILLSVFSNLFTFICITIASILTKKAKVIVAIGIYYGANSVITFITQPIMIFCIPALSDWAADFDYGEWKIFVCLVMLVLVFALGTICTMLYAFQYWLMDKKLNLS